MGFLRAQAVLSDSPVLRWIANAYDIDNAYGETCSLERDLKPFPHRFP